MSPAAQVPKVHPPLSHISPLFALLLSPLSSSHTPTSHHLRFGCRKQTARIMADEEENLTVKGEIINAIRSLCIQTETTYVNFFDRRTCNSENLTRPLGRVRYIIPTGSYALGEWEHGDDVHLVALTPVSRDVCWPALLEKLDIHHGKFTTFTDDLALSAPSLSRTKPGEQSLLADFVTLSRKNKVRCKFHAYYHFYVR